MLKTYSFFPLLLLWFGAAVSIAEILTGGLVAQAGLSVGLQAIILGHLVGCAILALVGYIGYQTGLPTIMATRRSFGVAGSYFLSLANMVQLIGWTAVMLQQGGIALGSLSTQLGLGVSASVAIIILGGLVGLWTWWEAEGFNVSNMLAVGLLAILAIVLTHVLWQASLAAPAPAPPTMPLGSAFDLVLIMPLSWVPLVADYTLRAKTARTAWLAPALGFFVGSIWMYSLGFFGSLYLQEADPTSLLLKAGLGLVALGIVGLSALTTTFLDVYSAAVSATNIKDYSKRWLGLAFILIGIALALALNTNLYMSFLHLIGAIFAPLSAIMCYDFFIIRHNSSTKAIDWLALLSLSIGMGSYMFFANMGISCGPIIACLGTTLLVHIIIRQVQKR